MKLSFAFVATPVFVASLICCPLFEWRGRPAENGPTQARRLPERLAGQDRHGPQGIGE